MPNIATDPLNAIHVIGHLIEDTYEIAGLRRNPLAALIVPFRATRDREKTLLLWSPMNYVGVFARDEESGTWKPTLSGEWTLLGYHDSCWRESVRRFLWEQAETLEGIALGGMKEVHVPEDWRAKFRDMIRDRGK